MLLSFVQICYPAIKSRLFDRYQGIKTFCVPAKADEPKLVLVSAFKLSGNCCKKRLGASNSKRMVEELCRRNKPPAEKCRKLVCWSVVLC